MRVITLGVSCNNACIFCAQGEMRSRALELPAPDDEIARIHPGEVVALVGGEPTLFDPLIAWIRAADAAGAGRILLQTNGRRLAYAAYARALREASPRLGLDVSLHGATEPMHDYHTSAPGSFRQTLLGLKNARAHGIEVAVTTVITRSNYRHLQEIVTLAATLGASAVHLAAALPFGMANQNKDRVVPQKELVRPYLERAIVEASRRGLALLANGKASAQGVHERFAGIGEHA